MYRLAAIAIVLLITLTGCWTLHDAMHPVFLAGSEAQEMIDSRAGDMLAALYPGVPVGRSKCGYLLDLTGERTAQCTIPVAGQTMRIDVRMMMIVRIPITSDVDALIEKHATERRIARQLDFRYGVRFTASCNGPPVRVVALKTPIACEVRAPGTPPRRITVTPADRDGDLSPIELAGVDTMEVRMLGRNTATRRTGGADIPGPVAERYLRVLTGGARHDDLVQRGLLGAAHCPPRVRLTPKNHVACRVRVGNRWLTYSLLFRRGRGFLAVPGDEVVIVPVARAFVQRLYERRLRMSGKPEAVRVDCGRQPVVVIGEDDSFPCTARTREGPKRLSVVTAGDSGAMFTYDDG
ncbi:MAG: hypothetical protein JWM87_171 [Candidatus Eremiobacteraeota bacterium]|nr:hypothetical protein [Candidatus Eremiobacteraeota bacterium]